MEREKSEFQAQEAALAKIHHERQRQKEMKFTKFAERVQVGLCVTDLVGNVIYANKPWYEFSGYTPETMGDMSWMDAVLEEDKSKLEEVWEKITIDKIPWTFEFRTKIAFTGSARNPHMRAEHRTGLCAAYPDFADDGKTVISVMGIIVDISETKHNEKVTTEKMEEAIFLRKRQEIFIDMISHEIRNPMSAVLHCTEEILDIVRPFAIEQALVQTNSDSSQPKATRNSMLSVIEASRTILYCIEHQRRIVDDVLSLSKLDSGLVELVPCPVQVMRTIRQVKISVAEVGVNWVMLDPNRFLQILINLVMNAIKFTRGKGTRQIIVKVSASRQLPSATSADIVYFPEKTIISDRMDEKYDTKNDIYLSCSVSDTGKGLSDDDHNILFNRFAQASPKTYIEYGGSGLGLFISRHITELMGGRIGVRKDQEIGSTFNFFIKARKIRLDEVGPEFLADKLNTPLDLGQSGLQISISPTGTPSGQEAPPGDVVAQPEKSITASSGKQKILVVEDNKINQRLLCKSLLNRGYVVDSANHGQQALECLLKSQAEQAEGKSYFDLVLCDIEMPVLNGIDCVRAIRRYEKEGVLPGHIPVLAVSANARREHVQRAEEAGMDGFTTKPYRMDELIAQLQRFLPILPT